jgi:hypothetical protein
MRKYPAEPQLFLHRPYEQGKALRQGEEYLLPSASMQYGTYSQGQLL